MGAASLIGGLLGNLIGGTKTPKVNTEAATQPINDAASKARKARQQMLETSGGINGDQLAAGQVGGSTGTVLGN